MSIRNNKDLVRVDAANRTVRTFFQGLGIDVAVGLALVLGTFFLDKNSWGEVEWTILTFSLAKSGVQAVAAYVMRRWLDPSRFPTPLPPDPVGEPNDDVL